MSVQENSSARQLDIILNCMLHLFVTYWDVFSEIILSHMYIWRKMFSSNFDLRNTVFSSQFLVIILCFA